MEKPDTIVTGAGEGGPEPDVDVERLEYARIDGPGPVLAYMAQVSDPLNLDVTGIHFSDVISTRKV